jgi:hypothetical protein
MLESCNIRATTVWNLRRRLCVGQRRIPLGPTGNDRSTRRGLVVPLRAPWGRSRILGEMRAWASFPQLRASIRRLNHVRGRRGFEPIAF